MNLKISAAQAADAPEIAAVILKSLGDMVSEEEVTSILGREDHITLKAVLDNQVVGFIDGFRTVSAMGLVRAELDLLGVLPEAQGAGIGRQLVMRFGEMVRSGMNAAFIRSLVRTDNAPMQRVMGNTGYRTDGLVSVLYVKPITQQHAVLRHSQGYLVPVHTLTYAGVWIEELAQELWGKNHLDTEQVPAESAIAGLLIRSDDRPMQEFVENQGFESVNSFQWWIHPV